MNQYIEALLREREGYVRYGNKARLADVDAELARVGYKAEKADETEETLEDASAQPVVEKAVTRRRKTTRAKKAS